jgi:hypothetical protein
MHIVEWLASLLTSKEFIAFTSAATVAGLVATLVSLRLALRSISDSRTIIAKSTHLVEELRAVGNSLTTHRVGEVPDYIDVIVRLIADARKTIQITTIHPGPGIFSAPEAWVRLANALNERQSQKVAVELLVASRAARKAALEAQFSDAIGDWVRWLSNPDNTMKAELFARRYKYDKRNFADVSEFVTFSLDVQERTIREVYWGAHVEVTDDFVPLISWITDDTEAFFAIANNRGRNTGFITRDQNMIQSFKSVRDRYSRVRSKERESAVLLTPTLLR